MNETTELKFPDPENFNFKKEEVKSSVEVSKKKKEVLQGSLYGEETEEKKLKKSRNQEELSKEILAEKALKEVNKLLKTPIHLTHEQLMDRVKCFEMFRKSYRKNEIIEENKEILKAKYDRGKVLGGEVNRARESIKVHKNRIEALRRERAITGLLENIENEMTPEEKQCIQAIEHEKKKYQEGFNELKDLKAEIERIQKLLERSRDTMQKDFEKWIETLLMQNSFSSDNKFTSSQPLPVKNSEVQRKIEKFYQDRETLHKMKDSKID